MVATNFFWYRIYLALNKVPRITVSSRNIKLFHESQFHPETSLFLGMARKKWTPQTEVTESLLRFREKRKWQLSYRRYVLERAPSEAYAVYFGLDIETLREWFELQFTSNLNWDNFGKAWQFEHIVPTAYFDYANEADLRLCWSFINLRVEKLDSHKSKEQGTSSLLSVKSYFQNLYTKTGFSICLTMLEKLAIIESLAITNNMVVEKFIINNKVLLESLAGFSPEEFNRLNKGITANEILLEREILRKFGSGPKP